MAKQIVGVKWDGSMCKDDWDHILRQIAAGNPIEIAYGYVNITNPQSPNMIKDLPAWKEGRASLKVKTGKKRKLVCGRLTKVDLGISLFYTTEKLWAWSFKPMKPRELRRSSVNPVAA